MRQFFKKIQKTFIRHFIKRSAKLRYKDVCYHTGFYRFSQYIDGNKPNFNVNGIPCLPQQGFNDFVFFTETNLVGKHGVIPVDKYYD